MTGLIENGLAKLTTMVQTNPVGTAIGAAGAGVAVGLGTAAVVGAIKSRSTKRNKSRSSRKRGRRIKHTKRGWKQDRKRFNKRQKWEVAYRKRKKKMKSRGKKVYYARKTGQPYIYLANGKTKFIKGKRRKR